MKKSLAILLALCLTLTCASALAAGKLEIVQETYMPMESYSSFYGYIFAEVKNTGDKNVAFGSGIYEILNADGDALESEDIYTSYPATLAPGETGYVYYSESVDDAKSVEDLSDHTLTLSGKSSSDDVSARLTSSGVFAAEANGWGGEDYIVTITITNDTDATVYTPTLSYGLYDESGKLLYTNACTAYNVGIPAGQTIEYKDEVYSSFTDVWTANGTMPATVNCIAYERE